MKNRIKKSSLHLTILSLALSLVTGAAFADKPDRAEPGRYRTAQEYRYQNHHYRNDYQRKYATDYRFQDKDRHTVSQYYRDERRRGKCSPGLAKKNQRCQPSGHYKKWHKGKSIAQHTQHYDLPRGLRSRLSAPQENYRYVRVDDNILLVDRVTNVVIDVIENILR